MQRQIKAIALQYGALKWDTLYGKEAIVNLVVFEYFTINAMLEKGDAVVITNGRNPKFEQLRNDHETFLRTFESMFFAIH